MVFYTGSKQITIKKEQAMNETLKPIQTAYTEYGAATTIIALIIIIPLVIGIVALILALLGSLVILSVNTLYADTIPTGFFESVAMGFLITVISPIFKSNKGE
jgi:uncharacterized membrane protein